MSVSANAARCQRATQRPESLPQQPQLSPNNSHVSPRLTHHACTSGSEWLIYLSTFGFQSDTEEQQSSVFESRVTNGQTTHPLLEQVSVSRGILLTEPWELFTRSGGNQGVCQCLWCGLSVYSYYDRRSYSPTQRDSSHISCKSQPTILFVVKPVLVLTKLRAAQCWVVLHIFVHVCPMCLSTHLTQ